MRKLLQTVVVALVLSACAGSETDSPPGEEIPPEPILVALEAYRGYDQYLLRYRRGDEVYYAAGDLRGKAPPRRPAWDIPQLADIEDHGPAEWTQLTRDLHPVPILGVEDWSAFRDAVFADFLPTERNTGVAVSFQRGEYFFFYDSEGRFRARRLIDKPPWYRVASQVNLEQYFDKWQPRLEQFLASRGLRGGEVLFNTGDLDRGAIPFVFVSLEPRLIVLLMYDEIPDNMVGKLPGSHLLQSLWHFVGSHTYSVTMRPFSSVQALMTLITDTAIESGKSLIINLPLEPFVPPLYQGPGMDLQAWELELDRRLQRPANRGELSFLVDGKAFFPRFLDTVTTASHSVDVRAYIFDNDDVALTVAEVLKRRSREGIAVRVLFDGIGSFMAGGGEASEPPDTHRAPMSISSHLKSGSRVKVRSVKNTWLIGDHVKTMVVDQRVAFLGGMNIGREYRYDWHDLMVEVRGPVVDEISQEFQNAWTRAGIFGDFARAFTPTVDEVNRGAEGYPLRLIHTGPGRQEIYKLQREAIRRSKRYIYIENAYFTDDSLLHELVDARRRGVDVRVIIPVETDRGAITRNIVLAANAMLKHGIRVYVYPGFTHAKAAVFDGWASVGTANMDRLSLKLNQEINIATSEPRAVQELLECLFEPDFAASTELREPLPQYWSDHVIEKLGDYIF